MNEVSSPDVYGALTHAGMLTWMIDDTFSIRAFTGPPDVGRVGAPLHELAVADLPRVFDAHRQALQGQASECLTFIRGRPYRLYVHPAGPPRRANERPTAVTCALPYDAAHVASPVGFDDVTWARTQALYDITQQLANASSDDDLLQLIVEQPCLFLQANRTVLITFDEDLENVQHYVTAGPGARYVTVVTADELKEGLTGWVLQRRQRAFSPARTPDERESPRVARRRAETHCGCIVVLPVQTRARIFGTLTVVSAPNEPDFTRAEMNWLEALANISATALEQRRLRDQLTFLAHHDYLTGLPNRLHWDEHLTRLTARSATLHEDAALLLVDLDGFKAVNDSLGHAVGDKLLVEVARRLRNLVRSTDTVARLGGDEFGVIASRVSRAEDARTVALKLLDGLRAPFAIDEFEVSIAASIGVGLVPLHGLDIDRVTAQADQAMYRVKRSGGSGVCIAGGPVERGALASCP